MKDRPSGQADDQKQARGMVQFEENKFKEIKFKGGDMGHDMTFIKEKKEKAQTQMKNSIESLKAQIARIRTGRAQPSMLDSIRLDYYGSLTPLSQVASISCPDAKSFLIAPWEASILKDIEVAINKSNIGMTPINDGKVIRLKLPELTEERRKDIVKQVKKIIEDAKISIRQARMEANDLIKLALKAKSISEDESHKEKEEIQDLTNKYIQIIDQIADKKEKEIINI